MELDVNLSPKVIFEILSEIGGVGEERLARFEKEVRPL